MVQVVILLPADLASHKIGGIQSFVRDFIAFAPADFSIELVGATTNTDRRPVGRWHEIEINGRTVRHFAVTQVSAGHSRERVPIALRYTAGLMRWRHRLPTRGKILQYHRAGVPLAFIDRAGPAIQIVHLNVAEMDQGESRWRLLPGLYHRLEAITLPRMHKVFVVNEAGVTFYRLRHPGLSERFEFLPTWYDDALFNTERARPHGDQRSTYLRSFGVDLASVSDRLVLFVGRLEKQKDPQLLVDSFSFAQQALGGLQLLVVGDGDLRQAAAQRAAAAGFSDRVHFLGWRSREDVARLMSICDALLLASRFEGMPITVLEALASGLPVAATAVGEVPRLVQNGESGWLARSRTPDALGHALVSVLTADSRAMSKAAESAAAPYGASVALGRLYDAHRQVNQAHGLSR